MKLRIPFIITVLVCSLLIMGGYHCLPIQADEKGIALAEGMEESLILTLAIEEAGSKSIEVSKPYGSHVFTHIEDDSGIVVESPTQEIPEKPALGSGYGRIVGIIIGICSLLMVVVIYLIKQKKI